MRKPLRFRALRDLSRPTPTRTALRPKSREGRRNRRLRQFGHPEKRQSRTLGQANRLRRHWNRNPVVALKRLRRNGRSGKSKPALEAYFQLRESHGTTLREIGRRGGQSSAAKLRRKKLDEKAPVQFDLVDRVPQRLRSQAERPPSPEERGPRRGFSPRRGWRAPHKVAAVRDMDLPFLAVILDF